MLWHNFRVALILTTLGMFTGCSGVKISTLDNSVDTSISSIAVVDTDGRAGQIYSRALRRALYVQGQANTTYILTSSISVSSSSSLSVRGVNSTFKKMTMVANFILKQQDGDKVLLSETVTADATLGTVTSLFSQDQSESHARDRMARLMAQRVVQRLKLYFLKQTDT